MTANFDFCFSFVVGREWIDVPIKERECHQAQRRNKRNEDRRAQAALRESSCLLLWCWSCSSVLIHPVTPIQDRSKASKYQVSPDMQHVLFAFDVKPVRGIYLLSPTVFVSLSILFVLDCVSVLFSRSTNTPMWPSTLFTALWNSKNLLSCFCRLSPSSHGSLNGQYALTLTSVHWRQSHLSALTASLWENLSVQFSTGSYILLFKSSISSFPFQDEQHFLITSQKRALLLRPEWRLVLRDATLECKWVYWSLLWPPPTGTVGL